MLVELGSTPQAPESANDAERARTGYPGPSVESLTCLVALVERCDGLKQVAEPPLQLALGANCALCSQMCS